MIDVNDILISENLYKVDPGGNFIGVLVPNNIMKKIIKLRMEHETKVKKLLTEFKEDLYAYEWNLAYPKGEQVGVYFAKKDLNEVEDRIKFFKCEPPKYMKYVYKTPKEGVYGEEAKKIIKKIENNEYPY